MFSRFTPIRGAFVWSFLGSTLRLSRLPWLWIAVAITGCDSGEVSLDPETAGPAWSDLTLIVVDDPEWAAVARRLQGEWKARTGSNLTVREIGQEELLVGSVAGDVVVYAPSELGELAESGRILPLSSEWEQSPELGWPDLFLALRQQQARWGSEVYAAPLGTPVFICLYRADLFDQWKLKPPETWTDYQRLVEKLAALSPEETSDIPAWSPVLEPLGPDWGGKLLLARAAAYARHPDQFSTLFNIDSLEPLIVGPPFVRALEELVAARKLATRSGFTPAQVFASFRRGECALAITWPVVEGQSEADDASAILPAAAAWQFISLPGSRDVYNGRRSTWSRRNPEEDDPHVPLLGIGGNIASVLTTSENVDAARRLLAWLSSGKVGERFAGVSPSSAPYRTSQVGTETQWTNMELPAGVKTKFEEVVEASLTRQHVLLCPRIPGWREYLTALDQAVDAAVNGESSPQDALQHAAERWGEITEELGLESQRTAYRHSTGMSGN